MRLCYGVATSPLDDFDIQNPMARLARTTPLNIVAYSFALNHYDGSNANEERKSMQKVFKDSNEV